MVQNILLHLWVFLEVPINAKTQPLVRLVWSGSAEGQDFPRSLALLPFLETYTEAHAVVAGTGGAVEALS